LQTENEKLLLTQKHEQLLRCSGVICVVKSHGKHHQSYINTKSRAEIVATLAGSCPEEGYIIS